MPLSKAFREELTKTLRAYTGESVEIVGAEPLGGGCINSAHRIDTTAGRFFLKYNEESPARMFATEAMGLAAMEKIGAIRVPRPIAQGDGSAEFPAYLLATYIQPGEQPADFFETFGRQFACFHREATGDSFGFEEDNYLGSTPQPNRWADSWVEFFRDRRLGHQLRLAERNGHAGELQTLGKKLLGKLDALIGKPAERPTLLHGDLWSGNFMCAADGAPVLVDPACYFGRREADLAMTKLFGGFPPEFYSAYEVEFPLAPGSAERLDVYTLYHLLNHLNLFGASYLGGCLEILKRYAGG